MVTVLQQAELLCRDWAARGLMAIALLVAPCQIALNANKPKLYSRQRESVSSQECCRSKPSKFQYEFL